MDLEWPCGAKLILQGSLIKVLYMYSLQLYGVAYLL